MESDPHRVLGVTRGADAATIRRAYRKLAKTVHPDAVGGDGARFAELQNAYSTLLAREEAPPPADGPVRVSFSLSIRLRPRRR